MSEPNTLVKKLAAIRREIRHIEKKGHNAFYKYDFMRAEDVAGDIGDKLAEANIVISREDGQVTMTELRDKGFMFTVECVYFFVDGDSNERLKVWSCGSGADTSDKGIYKAWTGAFKYALTQALSMRVGDDPEEDDERPKSSPPKVVIKPDAPLVAKATEVIEAIKQAIPNAPRAITAEQIVTMEARCKAMGTSMLDVLTHFKVDNRYNLTAENFAAFMAIMDRKNQGKK